MGKTILFQFFEWHFRDMPKNIFEVWKNFLRFNFNYFSIPLLFKTLFSHWHRYRYFYGKGFDLKRYFEVWTFNAMSRGLGAMVRIILLFIGLICEIFIILAGLIMFAGWFVLPGLLIIGLWLGLKIIL